jgi:hypothetical protein
MRRLIETYKGINIYREDGCYVANVGGDVMYESNLHDMRQNIDQFEAND